MGVRATASMRSAVTASLLAVALLLTGPAAVFAAPVPGTVDAKKAEKAAAEADVTRMTADLQAQTEEYAQLGRRIQAARAEIARVESETADLDAAIAQRRQLLRERAVELYRAEPMGMFAMLLGARSPRDFLMRLDYLTQVSESDAALVQETTRLYSQNLYLESVLNQRAKGLVQLLSTADDQQGKLKKGIEAAQARAKQLDVDITNMLAQQAASATGTGGTPNSDFNPTTVISDANFRAARSMDATAIQAYLNGLPGPLKSYSGSDHAGRQATAAQMIAEAAVAYNVSPKVILVTLQKEQSLLEKTPKSQDGWDWAMGAGKADSFTSWQFKGFGMQIWIGAQKLNKNALDWRPGAVEAGVAPTNAATFAQWRYTPHLSGVLSFWTLHWRYFGDPLSAG